MKFTYIFLLIPIGLLFLYFFTITGGITVLLDKMISIISRMLLYKLTVPQGTLFGSEDVHILRWVDMPREAVSKKINPAPMNR